MNLLGKYTGSLYSQVFRSFDTHSPTHPVWLWGLLARAARNIQYSSRSSLYTTLGSLQSEQW